MLYLEYDTLLSKTNDLFFAVFFLLYIFLLEIIINNIYSGQIFSSQAALMITKYSDPGRD